MSFISCQEGLREARSEIVNSILNRLPFGVRFLDESINGIMPDDLVLLVSGTGIGKTHLAMLIASHNAFYGNKVAFFALEATRGELHKRLLYQEIARLHYATPGVETITFRDFIGGHKIEIFEKHIGPASAMVELKYHDLHVFTRHGVPDLDAKTFIAEAQDAIVNFEVNLIILDHFHFLDLDGDDLAVMAESMKSILDFVKINQIPVICVCHVRKKMNFRDERLLMSLDDIQGSSNLHKMATVVVTNARSPEHPPNSTQIPTLFKILKTRNYGNLMGLTAKTDFDIRLGTYKQAYELGTLEGANFKPFESESEIPDWARLSRKEPEEPRVNYWEKNMEWLKRQPMREPGEEG